MIWTPRNARHVQIHLGMSDGTLFEKKIASGIGMGGPLMLVFVRMSVFQSLRFEYYALGHYIDKGTESS